MPRLSIEESTELLEIVFDSEERKLNDQVTDKNVHDRQTHIQAVTQTESHK